MKNRAQPFDCSIAGKTVAVSLRHGGGLQEPEGVYVRCDERDCQYVDLNKAPCPLTLDLFADGSDRRVTDHVAQRAGERFCYECLTTALDVTHDQVRRASWRLKEVRGFGIKPARCALCHRRRVTIGMTRDGGSALLVEVAGERVAPNGAATPATPPRAPEEESPLVRQLRTHAGFGFCAHCLARELGASPATMRDAMWSLEPLAEYDVRTAQCVSCLLTKRVIRHQAPTSEAEAPRRVIELLLKHPGAPYCTSCIAFATDMALPEARRIVGYFEPLDGFRRETAACSDCGRWQPVIALADGGAGDSARVAALGEVASGQVRHRGFRIDLLSFRTGGGWRPFALVKTTAGALVPDAPALFFEAAASKAEADELAVRQARDWLDKSFP
ncbi:MAG: hypothetical protein FJ027_03660 [Candidatus Rokubacteria bacterium]|nr:hypothetical protein [Candidatus Rokubacteria bacterium]